MSVSTQPRATAVEQKPPDTPGRPVVERLRLMLVSLGLTLAVFAQSAGNAVADTKLDLVVSPLRFLSRALRLWDPIGNAGQLQNQAYGYLFPMGPFFAGLHALGVAPWEIQRAWESTIVVAAFIGAYLVARRLGIEAFWPAVGAGLVYALAPRTLSELTSISSELMPVAALPWVLLPLIKGAERGSPRRAAALSAVALLFAGGVNAAATLAILPVPALWLLTRSRGPRRRALIGWWLITSALACAWWVIPLLQLGRYSPPFLDWIEASSTTTLPTSLLATLRGVDHWESYLGPSIWPGGWILTVGKAAIAATTIVAGAGLVGISRRDTRNRSFLWSSLLLGLVLLTLGHAATVGPPAAATLRSLLDGPLVPFRNLHKFDPLVRLPLAMGVGFVLMRTPVPSRRFLRRGSWQVSVPVRALTALVAVAVGCIAISPVFTNHLASSQRITTEPSWWSAAGKWLADNSHGARALVVPGSASPHYLWGGTVDNALQPVVTSPWTVRDSVPLTQPGYVRLLNEIEASLATGTADPSLASLLTRAGIGYVVIANDLNTLTSSSAPLLFVRNTLNRSPGFTLRASLGPDVGGSLSPTVLLDGGATVPRPAVQIYGVDGWQGMVGLDSLTGAVIATGSSDALESLIRRGLPATTPVLFGADAAAVPVIDPIEVTTDGIRKREASFATLLSPSVTMSQSQPYTLVRPVHDYLPQHPGELSAYRYTGIANVSVSSAGSDMLAFIDRSDRNGAWSALDGDPNTAWHSSSFSGAVGQWLQLDFTRQVDVQNTTIRFTDAGSALPNELAVQTDSGTTLLPVEASERTQTLRMPSIRTKHLRLTIASLADHTRGGSVAIAELHVPGVEAGRTLQVADLPSPSVLAFDAAPGYRAPCLDVSRLPICDSHYARDGEEDAGIDRSFQLGTSGIYNVGAMVRLTGGPQLDTLLDQHADVQATATSTYSADPRQRPGAAVDGDPLTAWQAAAGDATPVLALHFAQPRPVAGLTITTHPTIPVASPLRVTVTAGDEQWSGTLPDDRHVAFDRPVRTDTVSIRFDETSLRQSTDTVSLSTRLLPVGISEVRVDGMAPPAVDNSLVTLGCNDGVTVRVDGREMPMRVLADRADVLDGRPVPALPCSDEPAFLSADAHRVALSATPLVTPVSLTFSRDDTPWPTVPTAAGTAAVTYWQATERRVRVDATEASLLVVRENANAGWQATVDGKALQSAQVDGWQQAFVVPAGTHGTVELTFTPQRGFVIGLLIGAFAALCVVALAVVGARRTAHPPLHEARAPRWLLGSAAAVALALLAGWLGALVLAALWAAGVLVARTAHPIAAWLSGLLLVIAGFEVTRAGPFKLFSEQNAAITQLLCVAALAAGILSAVAMPRHGREP